MAEGLVEAGGVVHCLDRPPKPPRTFEEGIVRTRGRSNGSLHYHQVDVTDNDVLEDCVSGIAAEKQRLDGLIAGMFIPVMHCVDQTCSIFSTVSEC